MNRSWFLALVLALAAGPARAQEPPPAETPAPAAAPAPTEPSGGGSQGGYDVRLKSLRERVDELKTRVFDSKTKLLLLREQILHNLIAEARAVIIHQNEASAALTLEEVLYFLDNERIYYQSNRDGTLDERREFAIYNGAIGPGNHILSVEMVYRGNGKVFTYLSGYVFRIKSSFTFFAAKGQETRVRAIGYEKGGMTTRLEERPSVRFEMQQKKVAADAAASPEVPAEPTGK
jgi:hypothetical protein